jgi:hypothetical protein
MAADNDWSHEETDDPRHADRRNFYKDTCTIGSTPGIEIQKRPCLRFRPFRAHLVNNSAVNHFGAYAGGIAGDLDTEFHGTG